MVRGVPSSCWSSPRSFSSRPLPIHQHLRYWLGGFSRGQLPVRLIVSCLLHVFDQPPGAFSGALRSSGLPSSSERSFGIPVCEQHHGFAVSSQAGWDSFGDPQCSGSVHLEALRSPSDPASTSIHPRPPECPSGFPQPSRSGPWFRMDSLSPGLSGDPSTLACHDQSLRDESQSLSASVLFVNVRSAVSGGRCHDAVRGRSLGVRLPPFGLLHRVLSKVRQSWGMELTLVAPFWR